MASPVSGQVELVLTHFRVYDAELGRWLSADPLAEEGGMNLYAYVEDNPLYMSDLLGLWGAGVDVGGNLTAWPAAHVEGMAGLGYFSGGKPKSECGDSSSGGGIGGFASGGMSFGPLGTESPNNPWSASQLFNPYFGIAAAAGLGGFFTNANSPDDLECTEKNINFTLGWGPAQFGFDFSYGNGIWLFSLSPGPAGATFGGSVSIQRASTAGAWIF